MKFSKKEKNILYNFVIGEHNLFSHPNLYNIEEENGIMAVVVKRKPDSTNLNNFDDKKKYAKCLQGLIKKLQ